MDNLSRKEIKVKIYFTHKESNLRILLEDIKQNRGKQCSFHNHNTNQENRYDFEFIPLSDDFILEVVDEEFTIDELKEMIYRMVEYYPHDFLLDKIKTKLNDKIKDQILKGY